jgi:hypothetical protein
MRQVAKYYAILGKQTFSPLDLSPALWLDASDTATITASGGSVSQWNDKSGNGRNVTQGTAAAQPTTGTRTLNGLNVLNFDGGDGLVSANSFTEFRTNKAVTVAFVVITDRTNAANEGIVSADSGLYDFNTGFVVERSTTNLQYAIGAGSGGGVSAYSVRRVANTTTTAMLVVTDVSASANTTGMSVNAVAQSLTIIDGTMATSSFLSTGSAAHRIGIGFRPSYGSLHLDGAIAEVIVTASVLTAAQRSGLETYLRNKWGTP